MNEAAERAEDLVAYEEIESETQHWVDRVQITKCVMTILRDGKPAVVMMEAGEYQLLLRRLALMQRIARGERELADGQTHTQEEVESLLDGWLANGM